MACDITTLETDACANDFFAVAENEQQWRAIMLQLLYNVSGSIATLSELEASACENGFTKVAMNEQQFRAIELQLLCAASGG